MLVVLEVVMVVMLVVSGVGASGGGGDADGVVVMLSVEVTAVWLRRQRG
jgi:hypothetical protein